MAELNNNTAVNRSLDESATPHIHQTTPDFLSMQDGSVQMPNMYGIPTCSWASALSLEAIELVINGRANVERWTNKIDGRVKLIHKGTGWGTNAPPKWRKGKNVERMRGDDEMRQLISKIIVIHAKSFSYALISSQTMVIKIHQIWRNCVAILSV